MQGRRYRDKTGEGVPRYRDGAGTELQLRVQRRRGGCAQRYSFGDTEIQLGV